MPENPQYIVVKDGRGPFISEVINDCSGDLCVPTSRGESLTSILKKICAKIQVVQRTWVVAGDNTIVTGVGSQSDPYIISTVDIDTTGTSGTYPLLLDSFIVGNVGEIAGGDSIYTNSNLIGKIEEEVMLFIDERKVYPRLGDRFSFSMSGGNITFTSPLVAGTSFELYLIPPVNGITTTTSTSTTSTSTTTTSTSTTTTTSSTTTTTTLIPFDTILTFTLLNQATAQGVTATIGAPNGVAQFQFDRITPRVGLPANMDIYVNGILFMVVGFTTDYLGRPFRLIHSSGTVYSDVFVNGTINF